MTPRGNQFAEVIAGLTARGVVFSPPLSETAAGRLLAHLKKPIADDFLTLYRLCNGTRGDTALLLTIWPLEEVCTRSTDVYFDDPKTVCFADFSIEATIYGVTSSAADQSRVYSTETGNVAPISPSLLAWFSDILHNPQAPHAWPLHDAE